LPSVDANSSRRLFVVNALQAIFVAIVVREIVALNSTATQVALNSVITIEKSID
jgi:hypothetical protein